MEADLQHYYHLDVRDLWAGTLTLRRLHVLLSGLPEDALWWTIVRQNVAPDADIAQRANTARWGSMHELAAATIDAVNDVAFTVAQVNANRKLTPPARFPRPGVGKKRHVMSAENRARIDAWLASRQQRGGDDGGH